MSLDVLLVIKKKFKPDVVCTQAYAYTCIKTCHQSLAYPPPKKKKILQDFY
jgi:hypothetical protein